MLHYFLRGEPTMYQPKKANPYEELLTHLENQEAHTLTIEINVSVSALRKGLRKALNNLNASRGLLELDLLPDYVTVDVIREATSEQPSKLVKIALVDELPEKDNRFVSKFQFSVVNPEDVTNDNNSTTSGEEEN